MNYKEVIRDAWQLTQAHKSFMWWYAFIPELLGLCVGMGTLIYQVISFWKSPVFHDYKGDSFMHEIVVSFASFFAQRPSLGILLIVVAAILILLYFTLPVLSKGALIELIARTRNGQNVRAIDGVSYSFLHFLPLFEYGLLMGTFGFFSLLTEIGFIVRNLGTGALEILFIPFLLGFIVSFIFLLLFTYTQYFIVIDDQKMLPSIVGSTRLVVRHWQHTILMLILMLLITLRIFLNIVLVLLIPSLIVIFTGVLASFALAKVGLVLGILIGAVGMYFSAYLGGILEVFSTSVWVFTFLELTQAKEVGARETEEND